MKLNIRDQAPDFQSTDQNGKIHELSAYAGKWLLIYFYPKDDTPGCTREACSLRDHFNELAKRLTILGVSADTTTSHQKFITKYHLPFTLLADPEKKLITAYGANGLIFDKRTSFLINPDGKITKIYERVNPDTHATEVLTDIANLTQ